MSIDPNRFRPHRVVWDKDKVARVWKFFSSGDNEYFSRAAGDSLLKHVRRRIPLRGPALDFGSGPGHFVAKLLAAGIPTAAFDLDEESIRMIEAKFRAHPAFLGAVCSAGLPAPIPDDAYDTVFFIETIEHLLPEEAGEVLAEIYRLTKPGGTVVITTRNGENLARREVLCPECGAIFHRKQHLASFSASSLAAQMAKAGFDALFCRPVLFSVSPMSGLRRIYVRLRKEKMPSLLYIGRKK